MHYTLSEIYNYGIQLKQQLDEMLDRGEISLNDYDKGIVNLSYHYALNGLADDCLLMLAYTSYDYFSKYAVAHMDDEEYHSKCDLIFEVLSLTGHAPYNILATQKEGKA
jgi:hypothetical protein